MVFCETLRNRCAITPRHWCGNTQRHNWGGLLAPPHPPNMSDSGLRRFRLSNGCSRIFIGSLGYFVWELSFGILRLGTFAWDLSLGNFRLGSFALKRSFGNFRFGSFVWELSFGIFRLIISVWDLSLGSFRLGSFAWELSLGIFRLETSAWGLSLGNFGLGSFALKRSLGNSKPAVNRQPGFRREDSSSLRPRPQLPDTISNGFCRKIIFSEKS